MNWDKAYGFDARRSTGKSASQMQGTQLWKTWDEKANKNGVHKIVYWTSGEQYQGEWLDNKKHGKGTMTYKNGDRYEGEWEDNVRYRVRYNGSWMQDLPHGEGVLFADNGDMYQGEFMSGMRHGRGKQVYGGRVDGMGGDVYEGDWVNDRRHGRGTLSKANGDAYEGSWANDLREGEGTFYFVTENKRYDGMWVEDRPRCGEYSEIQDTGPGSSTALPALELFDAKEVYESAKAVVAEKMGLSDGPKGLEVVGEEVSVMDM